MFATRKIVSEMVNNHWKKLQAVGIGTVGVVLQHQDEYHNILYRYLHVAREVEDIKTEYLSEIKKIQKQYQQEKNKIEKRYQYSYSVIGVCSRLPFIKKAFSIETTQKALENTTREALTAATESYRRKLYFKIRDLLALKSETKKILFAHLHGLLSKTPIQQLYIPINIERTLATIPADVVTGFTYSNGEWIDQIGEDKELSDRIVKDRIVYNDSESYCNRGRKIISKSINHTGTYVKETYQKERQEKQNLEWLLREHVSDDCSEMHTRFMASSIKPLAFAAFQRLTLWGLAANNSNQNQSVANNHQHEITRDIEDERIKLWS